MTAQTSELAYGEVAVWRDVACVRLKTVNRHGDPVERSDDEAIALAETLLRLAGRTS